MKVSDYIVKRLEECGLRHVFMLTGGMSMHLNESFGKSDKIKYICCIHEQAASFAAESYGRITNNLGVCVATAGPGATNTITGIAASWIESTPLLVLSGQVKRADIAPDPYLRQSGVQEVNIVEIVKPITKYAKLLTDHNTIRYEIDKAIYLATHGRKGPVLLDIPLDIQAIDISPDEQMAYEPEDTVPTIKQEQLNQVKTLLLKAKRPVIYSGAGIQMSDGNSEFHEFINKVKAPVVNSYNSMGLLSENNPYYVGRPGAVGQRAANFIVQKSDLLIVIGTRLSPLQTGYNYKGFAPNATIVMVDIDQHELDKPNIYPDVKIHGDAKDFLSGMNSILLKEEFNYSDWLTECKALNNEFPPTTKSTNKDEFINSYELMNCISSLMTSEDVYVGGRAGTCVDTAIQTFKVKENQQVYVTKGLSSMGYGLPAAIGGAYATGKRVVTVIGDGGFAMNLQELEIIAREQLPIKIFILDNSGYSTIRNTQRRIFNSHFVGCDKTSGVSLGNMRKIAEAYGLKTFSLDKHEDLHRIVNEVLSENGSVLCNVKIDPDQSIEPRQASYKMDNGQMASRPLEDMTPFLDREIIDGVMSSK